MKAREWLARKLWPEAFADQDKFHFLLGCVEDVYSWCYVPMPAASRTAAWLLRRLRVHTMSLNEYHRLAQEDPQSIMVAGICQFREEMVRAHKAGHLNPEVSYIGE